MTREQAELVERLRALATTGDRVVAPAADGRPAPSRGDAGKPGGAPLARVRTLRVDVDTLDRLLDLAGEITVGRGRLLAALDRLPKAAAHDASEIHRESDRLHAELQELVMKARMEPLGPTLRRFARTVRDLGAALGKPARFVVEGEDVEVDTKVVEHVRDPLTHLVRNALSHGLEAPAARQEKGKDARGLVRLHAFRETGGIVIEIEDDGAGLSSRRIAERARELGILGEGDKPTERELHSLIFEPGFSTASSVTEVSGRGVGLDVVRRNVEALRGTVTVESREGRGTTFTIRLPLSLSIIPGFAVGVGDETFIVPLEAVRECLELPAGVLGATDDAGVVSLRGEPLPCRRLRARFALRSAAPKREYVVVVQHDSRKLGIVVDALAGESQTVLKPFGPALRGLHGLAGSAILGSGAVAFVIDLPGLFREAA